MIYQYALCHLQTHLCAGLDTFGIIHSNTHCRSLVLTHTLKAHVTRPVRYICPPARLNFMSERTTLYFTKPWLPACVSHPRAKRIIVTHWTQTLTHTHMDTECEVKSRESMWVKWGPKCWSVIIGNHQSAWIKPEELHLEHLSVEVWKGCFGEKHVHIFVLLCVKLTSVPATIGFPRSQTTILDSLTILYSQFGWCRD